MGSVSREGARAERLDQDLDLAPCLRLIDERGDLRLPLLSCQELLDLRADFFERRRSRRTTFEHTDDVKPERRFDEAARAPWLERKGRLFERPLHLSLRKEPQIAAFRRAGGIL